VDDTKQTLNAIAVLTVAGLEAGGGRTMKLRVLPNGEDVVRETDKPKRAPVLVSRLRP
jgi:hypothetical protein